MTTSNDTLYTEDELNLAIDEAWGELDEAKRKFVYASCECGKESYLKAIDALEETYIQLRNMHTRGEYQETQ